MAPGSGRRSPPGAQGWTITAGGRTGVDDHRRSGTVRRSAATSCDRRRVTAAVTGISRRRSPSGDAQGWTITVGGRTVVDDHRRGTHRGGRSPSGDAQGWTITVGGRTGVGDHRRGTHRGGRSPSGDAPGWAITSGAPPYAGPRPHPVIGAGSRRA